MGIIILLPFPWSYFSETRETQNPGICHVQQHSHWNLALLRNPPTLLHGPSDPCESRGQMSCVPFWFSVLFLIVKSPSWSFKASHSFVYNILYPYIMCRMLACNTPINNDHCCVLETNGTWISIIFHSVSLHTTGFKLDQNKIKSMKVSFSKWNQK